jgi:hypothetical protein
LLCVCSIRHGGNRSSASSKFSLPKLNNAVMHLTFATKPQCPLTNYTQVRQAYKLSSNQAIETRHDRLVGQNSFSFEQLDLCKIEAYLYNSLAVVISEFI